MSDGKALEIAALLDKNLTQLMKRNGLVFKEAYRSRKKYLALRIVRRRQTDDVSGLYQAFIKKSDSSPLMQTQACLLAIRCES